MSKETQEKISILNVLIKSISENIFVKFTLGKYRGKEEGLENIYFEPVFLQDEIFYAARSKYKTKDTFENLSAQKLSDLIDEKLGRDFLYGALYTTANDHVIEYNKRREPKLFIRKPTFTRVEIKGHNRIKSRFISSKAKYLHLLGITDVKGNVKNDRYGKFRQLDKFIEIVDSLYRESVLNEKQNLTVTDFGSGKSYLTFALYDYFNNKLNIDTKISGVEDRKELVELSNDAASQCRFDKLSFFQGSIINHTVQPTDIVVALHACDTATDEAIASALKANAEIIILAPCCQKYVRKQIHIPENLKSIFGHGIIEEHVSSFITDGLRALMLESRGYRTKVFEFISAEHTSKNIMITAVKDDVNESITAMKLAEIENIKQQFHLKDFYLDKII